jgi:excisionase family DNA binding protein
MEVHSPENAGLKMLPMVFFEKQTGSNEEDNLAMVNKTDVQLMTVPEAAEALAVSQKTIWDWVYSRRLSSTVIGRSRRIPAQAVKDLVERGMVPAIEKSNDLLCA